MSREKTNFNNQISPDKFLIFSLAVHAKHKAKFYQNPI